MASAHPPDEVLAQYGMGKLDEASTVHINQHVTACAPCRNRIAELSLAGFGKSLPPGGAPPVSWAPPAPRRAGPPASRVPAAPRRDAAPPPASRLHLSDGAVSNQAAPAADAVPPELAAMRHYAEVRELGKGGMGVVYLAHNTLMDREEVLKIVNKAVLTRTGGTERFLREIRSASKLNEPKAHPNVVKVFNAQQSGDLIVFSMEYIPGEDLAQTLKAGGPLAVHRACDYAYQAALGLEHAHKKGMVHRDIKPSNMMLTREDGRAVVKILDFGLAKMTREIDASSDLTGEGKTLGTPPYMAPEQIADATTADIRADIYSLGCTLYHFLTGNPPFVESNIFALMLAHKEKVATPLNEVRADVPPGLAAVVAKMLAKNPADRYPTPAAVAEALEPFTAPPAAGEPAPPRVAPAPAPADHSTAYSTRTEESPAPPEGRGERGPKKRRRSKKARDAEPPWHQYRPLIIAGAAVLLFTIALIWCVSGLFRGRTATPADDPTKSTTSPRRADSPKRSSDATKKTDSTEPDGTAVVDERLVGRWESIGPPPRITQEFRRDGTSRITAAGTTVTGRYTMTGDDIDWTSASMTAKVKVRFFSANEMELSNEAGQVVKYRRVK